MIDEDVPKIGRSRTRLKLPQRELISIATLLIMLIAVLAFHRSCAQGVGNMFKQFEAPDAGAAKTPTPSAPNRP